MIFRNHNNMLICCSRNISDYYQCWKQLCCTIFLWKLWCILFFRIHRRIESSKEQSLFEIELYYNITNDFTVTFDQFNASVMNKSIILTVVCVIKTELTVDNSITYSTCAFICNNFACTVHTLFIIVSSQDLEQEQELNVNVLFCRLL